jgi:multisubunit Na+/H+ antiporter MnhC subunit
MVDEEQRGALAVAGALRPFPVVDPARARAPARGAPPGQVAEPLVLTGLVIGAAATLAALAVVHAARPELPRQARQ